MKTIFHILAVVFCLARMDAASIRITGTLSWKIEQPDCTFKLDGAIQNLGTTSGTLKMVLWATPVPFPSKGFILAEHTLGQLASGYQFNDFTKKTSAEVPFVTGEFYFTISIVEYTTSGWMTRAYVSSGKKRLENGEFVTGFKWRIPNLPVIAPPAAVHVDDKLVLSLKALSNLNRVTEGTHAKTTLTVKEENEVEIAVADDDWMVDYTYATGSAKLYNKWVRVGRLTLDHGGSRGTSKFTLYFQTASSGVYKNLSETSSSTRTTWGIFTFN